MEREQVALLRTLSGTDRKHDKRVALEETLKTPQTPEEDNRMREELDEIYTSMIDRMHYVGKPDYWDVMLGQETNSFREDIDETEQLRKNLWESTQRYDLRLKYARTSEEEAEIYLEMGDSPKAFEVLEQMIRYLMQESSRDLIKRLPWRRRRGCKKHKRQIRKEAKRLTKKLAKLKKGRK